MKLYDLHFIYHLAYLIISARCSSFERKSGQNHNLLDRVYPKHPRVVWFSHHLAVGRPDPKGLKWHVSPPFQNRYRARILISQRKQLLWS
jgi:hypothetical protein